MPVKEYPETHQTGYWSVENEQIINHRFGKLVDFGIQIAKNGRVWICIDGVAFLRFSPIRKDYEET